jgi:hypothetical protein
MVIFEAYLVESGHPQDPNLKVFSVAGFIAPCDLWKRWELDWRYILSVYEIEPAQFHMKDYVHSNGAFASWKGKESKRRAFLSELLRTFNPLFVPIGSSVVLEDYGKLSSAHKEMIGDEYELCFKYVLLECVDQALHCPEGETVSIIFADQKEFGGHADAAWRHWRERNPDIASRVDSVTWVTKKDNFIPLLGADLIAYELREFVEEWYYKEPSQRRNRYPMQWLLRWLNNAGGTFNKTALERLALKLDEAQHSRGTAKIKKARRQSGLERLSPTRRRKNREK